MNLQALADPRTGEPAWISAGLPGSTHDLTAAGIHDIIRRAAKAGVGLLGDKGYQGAGGTVVTPYKGRKLTRAQKAHNRMVNTIPGPGERAFATLKAWRLLTKIRCCPQRVGYLARAVLTLHHGQESRGWKRLIGTPLLD